MRQLAIFTNPDDATVELRHDSGDTYPSVMGEADGRPAHLIDLPDSLPEGHGAWIVIDWAGQTLSQHGSLHLRGSTSRAAFHADVFNKPF